MVLEKFATMQMMDVYFPTAQPGCTQPEKDHQLLLAQLGWQFCPNSLRRASASKASCSNKHHTNVGAVVKTLETPLLQIKFSWSTLGATATAGLRIGLEVQVNDDDDGGARDGKKAWQNPSTFGTGRLN